MRFEFFASTLAFAGSSIYWLLVAFKLDAATYGILMQCQASFLIITALYSLRTYDLVFYLQKQFSYSTKMAFLQVVSYEAILLIFSIISLIIAVHYFNNEFGFHIFNSFEYVVLATILVSFTIFQGSSQAFLRSTKLDKKVAWANFLSALAFFISTAAMMLTKDFSIMLIFITALAANAVRPLFLILFSFIYLNHTNTEEIKVFKKTNLRQLSGFLIAGQFTNFLKNNLLAVETLLLGWIINSEAVALYRISRSFLNLTTVFLNVTYQRSYRKLLDTSSQINHSATIKKLNIQSIKVWVFSLPVVLAASIFFVYFKNDAAYSEMLYVVSFASITLLIVAIQQSVFADLALNGKFWHVNIAYFVGFLILVGGSLALKSQLNIFYFIGLTIIAGLVRYLILRKSFIHLSRNGVF